jgi:acyl dehydratase
VRKFEEISIGDTLGPLELFVSKDQCRNYARSCGMDAPRFTDDEGAKKEGLPGMILPGNMSLALLTKLVTDWIGSAGGARLIRIGTTYRVPVQPGRTLVLNGFITGSNPEERTTEIDVWIENEEAERLVVGTATVQFNR